MSQIEKECGCVVEQINLSNSISGNNITAIGENIISECSVHQQERITIEENRIINRIKQIKRTIIQLTLEKEKADLLGYIDIVDEKQAEINILNTELSSLE